MIDLRAGRRFSAAKAAPSGFPDCSESICLEIGRRLSPEAEEWVRAMAERLDPRGQRDAAIRSAARLVGGASVNARTLGLVSILRGYLSNSYLHERDLDAPPPSASALRRELWRIAHLTDGDGVSARTIAEKIAGGE